MAVREAMPFLPTPVALEKNNSFMRNSPPGEVFDLVDESPTTTNHYIQRKEFDTLQSQIVSSQQQRMGINFDTMQSQIVSSQQQRMGINFDTMQSQIVSSQQQQRGFNFNTMQSQIVSSQQQQSRFNFDTMQPPIVSSQQQQIWIDFDTMSQIFSSQRPQPGINFDTMQSRIVSSQQQESVLSFDTMQSQILPSQQQQQSEVNTVVSSNEDISPHQQRIEQQVDHQGIDLNKIPEQKPKRKKHRPKVIREGKPAKTPKPVTPKAKTPRPPRNSETPTGKRKYVRKKKELNTLETPSTVLQEIVDPQSRNGTKSARRSLNFDLEDAQTRDGFTNNAESQVREACGVGTTAYPSTNSFIYSSAQAQVTEVENSQAGIAFDLNISVNQLPNEYFETPETPPPPPRQSRQEAMTANHMQSEYIRVSENPVPPPQPSGREGQSSKGLPWQKEYMNAVSHTERYKESSQKPFDLSKMTDAVLKVTKRDHSLVDACINFIQSNSRTEILHGSHNTSRQSQGFTKVHKKKRTEDTQNGMTSNASIMLTQTASNGWKTSNKGPNISEKLNFADGRPNNTKAFTFADAQQYMALEKMRASGHMLFNQIQRQINRLVQDHTPTSSPATVDCSVISSPIKPAGEHSNIVGCNQPPTPDKLPESKDRQGSEICGGQAHVEDKEVNPQVKPKRRRKKNEQVSVNNISQNTDQPCLPELETASWDGGSSFRKPSIQITASSLGNSRENSSHCRISSVPDCQTSSNYRESVHASFQSGAIVPYGDPIDDIVLKLRRLSIKCVHEDIAVQAQNALVPYVGSSIIVPYGGPFDLTKKRRPRPKVDLDPESNRVWKLLMGSSVDDDAIDPDKEKWWEEERRVFNGRAVSFIARMHLVQGDRHFSPWKGSIVDSVVGVFLTQNVSDHLSSSAFMAVAARFPIKARDSNSITNTEKISRCAAERDGCIIDLDDTTERQGERSGPELNDQSPLVIHEAEHVGEKETGNSDELLCSNTGGSTVDYFKVKSLDFHEGEQKIGHASPDSRSGTAATLTDSTSVVEGEDRRSMEDVVSSQNSVVSPQNSPEYLVRTADFGSFSPLSNIEVDDLLTGGELNGLDSKSFMELLQMAETRKFQELATPGTGRISSTEYFDENNQLAFQGVDRRSSASNQSGYFKRSGPSTATSNHLRPPQHDLTSFSAASSSFYYQSSLNLTVAGMENANNITEENRSCLPPTALDINMLNKVGVMGRCSPSAEYSPQATVQKFPLANSCVSVGKQPLLASNCSGTEVCVDKYFCCQSNLTSERTDATSHIQYGNRASFQQKGKVGELHVESSQESVKAQAHMQNCRIPQTFSNSSNNNHNNKNNNNESSNNNHHNPLSSLGLVEAVESNLRYETCTSEKVAAETASNTSKAKKAKADAEKKQTYDWDSLRKKVCSSGAKKERNSNAMDSVDWEAVRCADVSEISHTIRERGMNNMLAERIKEFLNRLVNDHGSIDLEWLRDVPPDKAKDYLLSIRGLGLKSVECVRLLTLHHLAFPVDTNVGRICVRLGWVPLQPLPESLQLHLLEMYPVLETIQKYLWPRLCKLDQRTLYELHYQMITFGKVFCTKSKPNCNACPMRGECKHFASAFASARLALPAPEEKGLVNSTTPVTSEKGHTPNFNTIILPRLEGSMCAQDQSIPRNCEPIVEEPATPEPECTETPESAIEDAFYEDPEEIPTIKLNLEQFTQNLQNYMHENNMDLQDGDMSKALVAITPEAASIPMPKLKNVSRLRTEHQVYELPDTHPLLEGLDKREPDDPSPYLLAIWTPGETAQSIEPPKVCCDSQDTGKLCDRNTCFGCNSIREAQAQTVRGTLLIPCRTAMRGSFPLNGTYFQVNEVFADHESSRNPIDVPRAWIWNLARRTVYFGTSIPTIFKGLSTEGIQHCFWRGFVCVRGFERTMRAPRPLYARLHFPASKTTRNKKAAAAAAAKESSAVKKTATKSNQEP